MANYPTFRDSNQRTGGATDGSFDEGIAPTQRVSQVSRRGLCVEKSHSDQIIDSWRTVVNFFTMVSMDVLDIRPHQSAAGSHGS